MHDSWTCLMVENGPGVISDEVRLALKVAACDLHLKKWGTMHLVSEVIEGIIKTERTTHLVGTRSGVLFRAQIDCEDGTDYKINFLLSEEDLKAGAKILRQLEEGVGGEWQETSTRFPVPELYEFYELRQQHRRLH